MPRLKDLKDQQLYMLDREHVAGDLRGLFRSAIDVEFVREQWDQLVRVASSLRDRTAPAHVVLDRLAASSRSDRLARALTMLGRVVKTTFILRYIHDAAVRDRIHLQLNRAESRHALARRLFFANQGSFRTGDYAEIMNKVSALSVLSNSVLLWNTRQLERVVGAPDPAAPPSTRRLAAPKGPLRRAAPRARSPRSRAAYRARGSRRRVLAPTARDPSPCGSASRARGAPSTIRDVNGQPASR